VHIVGHEKVSGLNSFKFFSKIWQTGCDKIAYFLVRYFILSHLVRRLKNSPLQFGVILVNFIK